MAEVAAGQAVSGNAPSGERATFWRTVIGEWSSSGQTKVAFCRERGLSPSAFHWWKGELARRDAAKGSRGAGASSGTSCEATGRPAFVAVRVAEGAVDSAAVSPRANGRGEGGVEVVLGNGRRVRVGSGFDGELLAQVVQVLEGLAC